MAILQDDPDLDDTKNIIKFPTDNNNNSISFKFLKNRRENRKWWHKRC